jgi:peptide/nickel transport system substrate-binding protein
VRGRRLRMLLLVLAIASGVLAALARPGAFGTFGQSGGIFRISLAPQSGLDYIDPALSFTAPGWALLDTTCARLMAYPDRPPPAGFRLQPEVAAALPKVSRDLRTYRFRLRRGFRFSDGTPVRASAFARAINGRSTPQ